MRLSNIQITNLAGLQNLSTNIPAVAIITGRHGAGKSSFERALMYAFGRRPLAEKGGRAVQHDPSILRGTAASGEATLTFSADSDVEFLRVRVKPDSTERKIKMRGAKKWEDAADVIDDITNALGYNPMSFKDLAARDRLEAFLRVAKVEVSREDIQIAAGDDLLALPEKPGLDTINSVYDGIYKARTKENDAADTQTKYADQLEAALPPAAPDGDWNAEATKLRADKATLETSEAEEIRRIGLDLQDKKDAAAAVRREFDKSADEDINGKLAILRLQIETLEIKRGNGKKFSAKIESDSIESARTTANDEVSEIRTNNAPLHADLAMRVTVADERARSAAQAEGTRKAAATARAEATARKARSKAHTESLERLTELKATTGRRMKIQGVTIASPRDGQPVDICREEDGALIPFEIWNDADKDTFCLKMAILYRGPCGIVCIDNMGNWSPARQEGVIAACRKYAVAENMQFLLGRASDSGDLEITDVSVAPVVADGLG